MGEIIAARFSRRGLLKGALAVSAISATVSPLALLAADQARAAGTSAFSFTEVEAGVDEKHHVAEGYDADILLRWGDPLFADAPDFDPTAQSADKQSRQFGYNNDFVGYVPLEGSSEHGILVVNHEYTNPHLMFPGIVTIVEKEGKKVTRDCAAHQRAGRHRDGRAWRHHRRDPQGRRQMAGGEGFSLQPPHHRHDRDGDHRPGRRPRAAEDQRRRDAARRCSARSTTAPAA